MVGERKRKTPEGLSAVDTPPPSLSSALSPTLSHGAPLTKETCSLPAAARALATRRRDALLTILGQDSAPPPAPSLSLSVSLPMSTACFHDRDARVVCILRHEDFAVSRGKDNPLYVSACLAHPVGPWRAVTSQRSAKGNYQCGGSTSWKH